MRIFLYSFTIPFSSYYPRIYQWFISDLLVDDSTLSRCTEAGCHYGSTNTGRTLWPSLTFTNLRPASFRSSSEMETFLTSWSTVLRVNGIHYEESYCRPFTVFKVACTRLSLSVGLSVRWKSLRFCRCSELRGEQQLYYPCPPVRDWCRVYGLFHWKGYPWECSCRG